MTSPDVTLRIATPADAPELAALITAAYRGDEGWTSESALLDDERIDVAGVLAKLAQPGGHVLVSDGETGIDACCELANRGDGLAYFGLFAVRPGLQAAGLGRRVLAAAESLAVSRWGAHTIELTVLAPRAELIAWYERRGYRQTGERRPFPYDELVNGKALRDDLHFTVLSRPLP